VRRRLAALVHHLRTEHTEPARLGWAVGVGVFVGVLPLYGLHAVLSLAAAVLLGLNKATVVLASNVSLPIFAPVLVAAGIAIGEGLRFGRVHRISLDDARAVLASGALRALGDTFLSCLLGDAVLGAVLGAVAGIAVWRWALRRQSQTGPS
jgi:uncharacterized protein (DUF2062 family)